VQFGATEIHSLDDIAKEGREKDVSKQL
jgi:hypothetical protein